MLYLKSTEIFSDRNNLLNVPFSILTNIIKLIFIFFIVYILETEQNIINLKGF